ncbi:MAG: sigma-54-dependent Fis family transcriptional regulator [Nevskiaceae bacterium]|nr:MAG: sigma-54-dependent Fis family transcriptional regulator [Nevskiaceae bacterium]TBR72037.1 MAG: sigma-54-dependent Fis family transcriptional regulator [Nevskiaceae bacterium]
MTASPKFPTSRDLVNQIRFDTDRGKVWMQETRMLLVHSCLFQNLRDELVATIGAQRASTLLMRLGFHSGWRDAELARKLRPELSTPDAFAAGPQFAMIQGMVHVEPVRIEFDLEAGSFYGELLWDGAFEADLLLASGGSTTKPACAFLTGYSSGFTTFYMGRQILFHEVECQACGAQRCRIIGRPTEEWDDPDELNRILQSESLAEELFTLQEQLNQAQASNHAHAYADEAIKVNFAGTSPALLAAWRLLKKAAKNDITVFLKGETGVGKEVFARTLYQQSQRAQGPFVTVNCACIPPDLIESELFGVEKGAFTGAHASRPGKFERANGGTLFLDEVTELTPRAQAALLRVLQEGELDRVGGTETKKVDVRIIAASNEDLATAVANGKFRVDLLYRLNVFPVSIPALRERREDIPLLVNHFLRKFKSKYGKTITGITDKALQALMEHDWPGNIRELENLVERGIILTESNQRIDLDSLAPILGTSRDVALRVEQRGDGHLGKSSEHAQAVPDKLCETLLNEGFAFEDFEKKLLSTAMHKAQGNVSQAARLLGLSRGQMAYRLEKLEKTDAETP